MGNYNKYMRFGLLFNGIFLVANICPFVPEFIKGILVGLGLTLILMGYLEENGKLDKLRNHKKAMWNKIFAK